MQSITLRHVVSASFSGCVTFLTTHALRVLTLARAFLRIGFCVPRAPCHEYWTFFREVAQLEDEAHMYCELKEKRQR